MNLGHAHMMTGDMQRAQESWQQGMALVEEKLSMGVNDFNVLRAAVEGNVRLGRLNEAKELLARLEAIESKSAYDYFEQGILFEYVQNREKALIYFQIAYEQGFNPDWINGFPWLNELMADSAYQALVDTKK